MPSSILPSTFASAASARPGGTNSDIGDWSRRPNGSAQTFRRSLQGSGSSTQSHQREPSIGVTNSNASSSGVYVPPHISASRNGAVPEMRYSRTQLLDLFKTLKASGELDTGLSDLYVGDCEATLSNGGPSTRWGSREETSSDHPVGLEVCCDLNGASEPLSLVDMTEEEKEIFLTTVNSPLKPGNQSNTRDSGQWEGSNVRKMSLSHSSAGANAFANSSPTVFKNSTRRRDPSDSFPFSKDHLASSSNLGKSSTEDSLAIDSPSSLLRRRIEIPDVKASPAGVDRDKGDSEQTSGNSARFDNLKRLSSGPLSAGLNGQSSPWATAPQSSLEHLPGLGAQRNESRFLGLMGAVGVEEILPMPEEKSSMSSLGRLSQATSERRISRNYRNPSETNMRTSLEADIGDGLSIGNGSLRGAEGDTRLLASDMAKFGINDSLKPNDRQEYTAFSSIPQHTVYGAHDQFQLQNFSNQGMVHDEPTSPTFTNPYQSPHQRMSILDNESEDLDINKFHLPGLGGLSEELEPDQLNGSYISNRFPTVHDSRILSRGQSGNPPTNRGFPSLGGLGGLANLASTSPWSPSVASGTPGREKAGYPDTFGDATVRSAGALQSPSFGGLASGTALGTAGVAGFNGSALVGRGSKLSSLMPTTMQEQMRSMGLPGLARCEDDSAEDAVGHDDTQITFGTQQVRNTSQGYGPLHHEAGNPLPKGRGKFDEFFSTIEGGQTGHNSEVTESADLSSITSLTQPFSPGLSQIALQRHTSQTSIGLQPLQNGVQQSGQRGASSSSSSQPPAAQQKTMVMPDRIRWIYRDPQGNTQGPWSGLEMHDWYRAGFFSPELLVKKAEDPDYEPLAQLIRRIGNSREPFLVPQIGIPAPVSTQMGAAWSGQNQIPATLPTVAAAQPPFANSFPSFGTTLTAEQQNALERRKQEEQYLMARQKEHLAQQQTLVKQMQLQGSHSMHPQPLNHHSSAQSLQSQPSFSSITSPKGYQASPMQGPSQPLSGPFDSTFQLGVTVGMGPIGSGINTLGHIQEEEMPTILGRTNFGHDNEPSFPGGHIQSQGPYHSFGSSDERMNAMLTERARLQKEQTDEEMIQRRDKTEFGEVNERLQQFRDLRYNNENEGHSQIPDGLLRQLREQSGDYPVNDPTAIDRQSELMDRSTYAQTHDHESQGITTRLSLTEQVQHAASAKDAPTHVPGLAWAKVDAGVPESLPPPSASPLPAPAAQRNRQHVADNLTAESASHYETSSVETPTASLAPWAKEIVEVQKHPSLREIQALEARKAAKQEEVNAAARRAALEKELSTQPVAAAPGLPISSTWARSDSPATPVSSTASAWTKPAILKTPVPANPSAKKPLQQILKEEEALARKQKAAAAAAAVNYPTVASGVTGQASTLPAGKRYAELAGRAAVPTPLAGGAWTTVGAGGKLKVPAPPTGPSAGSKTAAISPVATAAAAARPKPATVPSRSTLANAQFDAREEFKKWAVERLRPDLNKNVSVDDFVQGLLSFPADMDIITEAVHSVSQTMDSRHFAEEFIRRRGLADKGKTEPSNIATASTNLGSEGKGGSGWSEVARKGPAAEKKDEASNFKIVAPKKKTGKK